MQAMFRCCGWVQPQVKHSSHEEYKTIPYLGPADLFYMPPVVRGRAEVEELVTNVSIKSTFYKNLIGLHKRR